MTKTRTSALSAALIAAACATWLTCAGCAAGRHYEVDANEFMAMARRGMGSIHSQHVIGVSRDRAYLEVWQGLPHSLGGGTHVYSTELAGLPADIREALIADRDPFALPGAEGR